MAPPPFSDMGDYGCVLLLLLNDMFPLLWILNCALAVVATAIRQTVSNTFFFMIVIM